jgi:hypothetical protein
MYLGSIRNRTTGTHPNVWIHPNQNAEFCHFFTDVPGDLSNFYVEVCTSDGPDELLDELQSDEDLECWLQEFQSMTI